MVYSCKCLFPGQRLYSQHQLAGFRIGKDFCHLPNSWWWFHYRHCCYHRAWHQHMTSRQSWSNFPSVVLPVLSPLWVWQWIGTPSCDGCDFNVRFILVSVSRADTLIAASTCRLSNWIGFLSSSQLLIMVSCLALFLLQGVTSALDQAPVLIEVHFCGDTCLITPFGLAMTCHPQLWWL